MPCEVSKILLNPEQRQNHIKGVLELDGLSHIEENPKACYCAVPLTGVPESERLVISHDHDIIKESIVKAGISIYDPKDSKMNPWVGIHDKPEKVYTSDTIQVATPRFFEFTNIGASTGAGIEQEKARRYIRIPVILTKKGRYVSRMSTGMSEIILLEYDDIDKQANLITKVFKELLKFEPGVGICKKHGNVLIGFNNKGGIVCLKGLIESSFPELKYNFAQYVR
jgi:hypothetical protein